MRVTEGRLAAALTRQRPAQRADAPTDPAAALLVEAMAEAYPQHSQEVREAGQFLCALVDSAEDHSDRLTPSVAMHTFVRDEATPPERMWAHLAATAQRDVLLGLSAQALLRGVRQPSQRTPAEHQAVLHTLFLLVRAFEVQEETDALERALHADDGEPTTPPPEHSR